MLPADQAVEVLVHEYYKLVFHTIYGLTGNWEESQNLTQDTFEQALKGIDAARTASGMHFHAKAWLLRIAVNTVRMQRRRHVLFRFIPFSLLQDRNALESEDAHDSSMDSISAQAVPVQPGGYAANAGTDPAELISEQDTVRRAMAKVPEQLRLCLLLSIVGGLSNAEIASTLELQEPAVRKRLERARKEFRQAYEYESGEMLVNPTQTVSAQRKNSHPRHNGAVRADQSGVQDQTQRLTLSTSPSATWR